MFSVFASVLLVGSVLIQVHGNDFEPFERFRQIHASGLYYQESKQNRRFCIKHGCSKLRHEELLNNHCGVSGCKKRSQLDDVGPFWANRGKKDPTYQRDHLYVEEPRWVLVRRAQDRVDSLLNDYDPFFITRGKKDKQDFVDRENNDVLREAFKKMHFQNQHEFQIRSKE